MNATVGVAFQGQTHLRKLEHLPKESDLHLKKTPQSNFYMGNLNPASKIARHMFLLHFCRIFTVIVTINSRWWPWKAPLGSRFGVASHQ